MLAVSGDERVEGVDAPTLNEAGIDLTFTNWRGSPCAAGDLGRGPSRRWSRCSRRCTPPQAWKDALVKNGWSDAFMTGAAFESFLKEQDNRVETTLTELGLV